MTRPSRSFSRTSLPVGGSRMTLGCVLSASRDACSSPVRLSISALGGASFVVCCMVFPFFASGRHQGVSTHLSDYADYADQECGVAPTRMKATQAGSFERLLQAWF